MGSFVEWARGGRGGDKGLAAASVAFSIRRSSDSAFLDGVDHCLLVVNEARYFRFRAWSPGTVLVFVMQPEKTDEPDSL